MPNAATGRAYMLSHGALSVGVISEMRIGWRFDEGVGSISQGMFRKGSWLAQRPSLTYSAENAVPASGLERHRTV